MLSMAFVSSFLLSVVSSWSVPPPNFTGDGTFYQLQGSGNCGYERVIPLGVGTYEQLPFATGIDTFVALNSPQYEGPSSCGQCLVYMGTGAGSGTTPVAGTPQYAMTNNRCPECAMGDLDLARPGDGRWRIEWTPLECAVGDSSFQYAFEGSNDFYLKLRVLNGRVPTRAMAAKVGGSYRPMTATQDNAFLLTEGGPFTFPLAVQLTSVQGATVTDVIAAVGGPQGSVQGAQQYPPSGLGQVDTTSQQGAGVQSLTPGSVQTCNVTLDAFSVCGGIDVGVGDASIPGACCPDGFACIRQNPRFFQCLPEAIREANTTFAARAPRANLAPETAPAAAQAPTARGPPSTTARSPIVCQLVQELLEVPDLRLSCGWALPSV